MLYFQNFVVARAACDVRDVPVVVPWIGSRAARRKGHEDPDDDPPSTRCSTSLLERWASSWAGSYRGGPGAPDDAEIVAHEGEGV